MAMLFGTPQGRLSGGYKASLVARVHMRLGIWRSLCMPSEVQSTYRTLSIHVAEPGVCLVASSC